MSKEKTTDFFNSFPSFYISGKYVGNNIVDLRVNCAEQICSTSVDFFPKWHLKKNKIILEFTPKLVYMDSGKETEMTLFKQPTKNSEGK